MACHAGIIDQKEIQWQEGTKQEEVQEKKLEVMKERQK
jgi:hypothetical protein